MKALRHDLAEERALREIAEDRLAVVKDNAEVCKGRSLTIANGVLDSGSAPYLLVPNLTASRDFAEIRRQ